VGNEEWKSTFSKPVTYKEFAENILGFSVENEQEPPENEY